MFPFKKIPMMTGSHGKTKDTAPSFAADDDNVRRTELGVRLRNKPFAPNTKAGH